MISMENMYWTETDEPSLADREGIHTAYKRATYVGYSALILYGTMTGNAELLAHRLAAKLDRAGVSARVRNMADCQPQVLARSSCVLLVTSTCGDGKPPEDAAPFCEAVVNGKRLDLRRVRFSILALGNTTFDHFCKCGRDLDAALERHGATRLCPRVDCDVDYDGPARRWMEGILTTLQPEQTYSTSA